MSPAVCLTDGLPRSALTSVAAAATAAAAAYNDDDDNIDAVSTLAES